MDHEFAISHASYGKAGIRAMSWSSGTGGDLVREVAFQVLVEGRFLESYRDGDNCAVLPSDTLRRHALAECAENVDAPPEDLAQRIAARVLAANPAFDTVTVAGRVQAWRAVGAHSFTPEPWWGTVAVRHGRNTGSQLTSGIAGLRLLTTAGSSFTGFLRDELTERGEINDRPLMGTLEANWTYDAPDAATPAITAGRITEAVADRTSNSIQQLLTDAGTRLLNDNPALATIELAFSSTALSPAPDGPPIYESADGPAGITRVALHRR